MRCFLGWKMDNVFLIQTEYSKTIDGRNIVSLMGRYANWYLDKFVIGEEASLLPREKLIPVGNIFFVQSFLEKHMEPLEVPKPLRKYLEREYFICKGEDIPKEYLCTEYFFKDADNLKAWNNALNPHDLDIKPDTNYVVSRRVEFSSEYRVFVHEKEILAVRHYLGDPLAFPDPGKLREVVSIYEGPKAYTLDIGMHGGKTDILEIHPFASCGLYGFYDKEIIPMLKDGYEWYEREFSAAKMKNAHKRPKNFASRCLQKQKG